MGNIRAYKDRWRGRRGGVERECTKAKVYGKPAQRFKFCKLIFGNLLKELEYKYPA